MMTATKTARKPQYPTGRDGAILRARDFLATRPGAVGPAYVVTETGLVDIPNQVFVVGNGDRYLVDCTPPQWRCECEAGQRGACCFHKPLALSLINPARFAALVAEVETRLAPASEPVKLEPVRPTLEQLYEKAGW